MGADEREGGMDVVQVGVNHGRVTEKGGDGEDELGVGWPASGRGRRASAPG